ncbi:MAG: conotoxin [Gemmataceae bacterium]|nr:conotoxin [Gemmataceae bacterium]
MRCFLFIVLLTLLASPPDAEAQTADEVTKLIQRLVELDSIDLAKDVKFRAGLEPPLYMLDADESAMKVLRDPYEVQGQNKPGAAGWYRVSFTVPEKLGKFAIPKGGYNLGVESNVLGSWEIYTYNNGKPAGAAMATGATRVWNQGNVLATSNQHAAVWMSNAPLPTKAGDKITVAILATAVPLGRGSPEGFALRHLRLRFALAHTGARIPFYGNVSAPGVGTGLHGARELLATRKGEELKALQEKLKGPLSRMDALFDAAETGQLDALTKAMQKASKEISEALKK